MIGLELSPDNKFAAAYTNNNQTILLNTLFQFKYLYRSRGWWLDWSCHRIISLLLPTPTKIKPSYSIFYFNLIIYIGWGADDWTGVVTW